jgi:outer membrane protein assembly factor BamB
MKLIAALVVAIFIIGTAAPAHALPNYVASKDVVYAATSTGVLRVSKLDVTTGLVWLTNLVGVPGDLVLSLSLDKDVLYVTGASNTAAPNTGFVWALDTATGQILWQTTIANGGAIYSSATVHKGIVYVAGTAAQGGGRTTALDAATGQILWTTVAVAGLPLFSSPTVDKDVVIVVTGGTPGVPVVAMTMDALTGAILSVVPAP